MFLQQKDWETRENAFAAFTPWGHLNDFWRQREEAEFTGVDNVPVRFVRSAPKVMTGSWLFVPGRIESYVQVSNWLTIFSAAVLT